MTSNKKGTRDPLRETRSVTDYLREMAKVHGSINGLSRDLGFPNSYLSVLFACPNRAISPSKSAILLDRLGLPLSASVERHQPIGRVLKADQRGIRSTHLGLA